MASGSHPAHGTEKLFKTSGLNQEKENQRNQRKTLIVKEKKSPPRKGVLHLYQTPTARTSRQNAKITDATAKTSRHDDVPCT